MKIKELTHETHLRDMCALNRVRFVYVFLLFRISYYLRPELASHTFGEGHKFDWTHACILQFESNTIYRIYKEVSHLLFSDKHISQAILENSRIWLPEIG
jgi:hypothetical protein